MTTRAADPNELGAFLKARRSELTPSDVGLPEGGTQRRVSGLRREEVAQLAAISTDYYTRLEQGRISASAPVLASLARVLQLNDDQRTYLYELAGTNAASAKSRRRAPQKVKPHMQRVLDHITDTPGDRHDAHP
jgi:transcriptional regulator with XRE-family HTH domain